MKRPNYLPVIPAHTDGDKLIAKVLQCVVALFVFTSMSVFSAFAYDGSQKINGEYFYYNVINSSAPYELEITYETTSYNSYTQFYLEIPSTVRHYINGEWYDCTVVKIGDNAFKNCKNLKYITLPSTLRTIGQNAFYGASNLEAIKIPKNVESIGTDAFYNCTKLKYVINHAKNLDGVLYIHSPNCGNLCYYAETFVCSKNSKTIGDFVFSNGVLVDYVGSNYDIELPESLDGEDYEIGPYSFFYNKKIYSVKFPPHAKGIHSKAFNYNRINTIYIDSDLYVYDINKEERGLWSGYGPFYTDSGKKINVTYGRNVKRINCYVLQLCDVESIDIYEGPTYIDGGAFIYLTLDNLNIPSSVKNCFVGSLYQCHPKNLTIGEGITASWIDYALRYDDGEDGVKYSNLDNLVSVNLPSTLDPGACEVLYNCPAVTIPESNPYAKLIDGVVIKKDGSRIIKITNQAPCDFVVPDGVDISWSAIERNTRITSITGVKCTTNFNIKNCTSLKSATIDAPRLIVSGTPLTELKWTGGTKIYSLDLNLPSSLKAIIPETVKEVEPHWIYGPDTIIMLPTTPPTCSYWDGEGYVAGIATPTRGKVLVPPGSLESYQNSGSWPRVAQFDGIIKEQPTDKTLKVEAIPTNGTTYQWYFKGEDVNIPLNLAEHSTGSYGWVLDNSGRYVSTNKSVKSSSAIYEERFDVKPSYTLVVNWEVSSEQEYDYLYIYLNGEKVVTESGEKSGVYKKTFDTETSATLRIVYTKDSSQDSNNDCAYISGTLSQINKEIIEGETGEALDILNVGDGDRVACEVAFSTGYKVMTQPIIINKKAELYNGTTSKKNVVWTDGASIDSSATADNALMIIDFPLDVDAVGDNVAVKGSDGGYVANNITLTDAKPFFTPNDILANNITYTRNFKNTSYQPLYVPFAMSYSDWSDKFTVAELAGVHMYEDKNTVIEFISVNSGDLKPNTPYVIKAKNVGEATFSLPNATLKAVPEGGGQISCSSPRWTYTMKGTYQTISRVNSADYVMSGGSFGHTTGGLNGFRFYLVRSKSDNGYWSAPAREDEDDVIYIMVDGEICGIADAVYVEEDADGVYYDLNGRVVNNPDHGIYIYKGKKILIK